jgi:hypothetical protein
MVPKFGKKQTQSSESKFFIYKQNFINIFVLAFVQSEEPWLNQNLHWLLVPR